MLIKQHPIFYSRIFSAAKVKATLLSFVYVRIQFFTKAVQPFLLLFALLESCKIVTSQGNFSPFLLRRPLEPCKTVTSQGVKSQGWYCTLPFHSMLCTVSSTNLLLSQRRVPTHPDYLLKKSNSGNYRISFCFSKSTSNALMDIFLMYSPGSSSDSLIGIPSTKKS